MERRDWWIEIPPVHSMFNFKWQPVSFGIKFELLSPIKPKIGEIGTGIGSTQYNTFSSSIGGSTAASSNGSSNVSQVSNDNVFHRQMVNHVENHHLISEKANLFNIYTKHCENFKENVFDVCPLTFYVEIQDIEKSNAYSQALAPFIQFYQVLEENKNRIK